MPKNADQPAAPAKHDYGAWLRLAFKILFLSVLVFCIFGVFFGLHRVTSVAMSPNIKDGDLAFFMRYDKN